MKAQFDPSNLSSQLSKTLHITPQAAQEFFDRNQIRINLSTHEGLENVIRVGGSKSVQRPTDADADYMFGETDMTESGDTFGAHDLWQFYVRQMVDGIRNVDPAKKGNPAAVYVYREGEEFPRKLSFDAERKELTLSEPADVSLPRPEYPGYGKAFLHFLFGRLFGVYNDVFDDYHAQMETYNARMDYFRHPNVHRGERIRTRTEQETRQREAEESAVRSGVLPPMLNGIKKELDTLYSGVEEMTMHDPVKKEPTLDRLDCVIIGGRTARACIFEACLREAKPGDGACAFSEAGRDLYRALNRDQLLERLNALILDAQLNGKTVSCIVPDPKTGKPVPAENGKSMVRPLVPAETVTGLREKNPSQFDAAERLLHKIIPPLPESADAAERLRSTDACVRSALAQNYFRRLSAFAPDERIMTQQLFRPCAEKRGVSMRQLFSTLPADRPNAALGRCVCAAAIASLLAKGMKPEDLFDPEKGKAEKAEMGNAFIERYEAKDYGWIAEQNVKGSRAIQKLISEKLGNLDFNDDRALFSEENLPVLTALCAMEQLNAARTELSPECLTFLAKENGLTPDSPETQSACDALALDMDTVAGIGKIVRGAAEAAELASGILDSPADAVQKIVSGELMRTAVKNGTAAGKPLTAFTDAEGLRDLDAALAGEQAKAADAGSPYAQTAALKEYAKLKNFGQFAENGILRSGMRFDVKKTDGKASLVMEPKADAPHEARNPARVSEVSAEYVPQK